MGNKHKLLSICEKIVYHELKSSSGNSDETSGQFLLKEPELKLCQKLSKFLLFKGSINQQILGLKYYQSLKNSQIQTKNNNSQFSSFDYLTEQ